MVPAGSGAFDHSFFSSSRLEPVVHRTRSVTGMCFSWLWMRYRLGSLIIINLQIAWNVLLKFVRND